MKTRVTDAGGDVGKTQTMVELAAQIKDSVSPDKLKAIVADIMAEHRSVGVERMTSYSGATKAIIGSMDLARLHQLKSKDPQIQEFQRKCDDLMIVGSILACNQKVGYEQAVKSTRLYNEEFKGMVREMKAAQHEAGSDPVSPWVPTNFSATLEDEISLTLMVAALHREVTMPTNPFKLPVKTGGTVAKRKSGGPGTNVTNQAGEGFVTSPTPAVSGVAQSAISTTAPTLDAATLAVDTDISDEADEDAIVAVLSVIRTDIVDGLRDALEDAIINGDASTTHRDEDITSGDDPRTAWDGYREISLAASTEVDHGATTLTASAVRAIRAKMGKYGVNPRELTWVTGINAFNQFLDFPELLTLDKYGSSAVILTGEVAKFDGIPLVISEFIREDLDNTATVPFSEDTTDDITQVLLVRRDQFVRGNRRDIRVETDRNIQAMVTQMVSSARWAFAALRPTDTIVASLQNVTLI